MSKIENHSLRLADLMASLSLAIDLGLGQPMEWVIRCTLLGTRLAEVMALSEADCREVYYLSLLRHIGCTANSHSDAQIFGDELTVAEGMTLDNDDLRVMLKFALQNAGKGHPWPQRFKALIRLMSMGPEANHTAHCEVAAHLAELLGFDETTKSDLWQIYERWDGKGTPRHIRGDDLSVPARVIHLAQDAATFFELDGLNTAVKIIRSRSGRQLDPAIVDLFCKQASDLCDGLATASAWDTLLAAEPGTPVLLSSEQIDTAVQAVAAFTDLKSPFTLNHSSHVAQIAEAAALECHLQKSDITLIRRAALIHDVGRVGVSSSIWGKPGKLTDSEWERVRLHPYYTERIFTRAESLAPLGTLAAQHHERLDGSGYHRKLPGSSLGRLPRLLAAADAYAAMTELRPHRPAMLPEKAAEELRREARAGKFDLQTVDDVLSAAGHKSHEIGKRQRKPTTLSERELEVLRLLVRGLTNKQMAAQLIVAEKTIGHHVQHIYNKIGVSTRAAATLFAMQNNLL